MNYYLGLLIAGGWDVSTLFVVCGAIERQNRVKEGIVVRIRRLGNYVQYVCADCKAES